MGTDVCGSRLILGDGEAPVSDPGPHYVHNGMWQVAKNILDDIEQRGTLLALFRGEDTVCEDGHPAPDCRGFRLVIVGHSLGAGAAQLLALLMVNDYPDLRCY